MKLKRNLNLIVESSAVSTGDIAFNLIVFFLVCASTQPSDGRRQVLPRSENQAKQTEQKQNLEVAVDRTGVMINAERIPLADFSSRLKRKLQGKQNEDERIVVIKSSKDVPYHHWISITGQIEAAGGIITMQLEEERQVQVQ